MRLRTVEIGLLALLVVGIVALPLMACAAPVLHFGVTFDVDLGGQSAGYPYAATCYGVNIVTNPPTPSDIVAGCLGATMQMGTAEVGAQGTGITASFAVNPVRVQHPSVESAALLLANRVDMGTGYAFGAPIGSHWLVDAGLHGPIGVRPDGLHGIVSFLNNYFDGSPSTAPSAALEVATAPGAGTAIDPIHAAATTYPIDAGILVAGHSSSPGQLGFHRGLQIGGVGAWTPGFPSVIGTGVDIRDYVSHGIYLHTRIAGSPAYALLIESDAGAVILGTTPPPPLPPWGYVVLYPDATDLRFHDVDATGIIGTTVVAAVAEAHQFITGISPAGIVSHAPVTALPGLPVYATNAAARTAGLVEGALYRTGGDPDHVCVVH